MEQRQLVGLITRRSQVRVLPPLPTLTEGKGPRQNVGGLAFWPFTNPLLIRPQEKFRWFDQPCFLFRVSDICIEPLRGRSLQAGTDMAICIKSDLYAGMTYALLHNLRVNAVLEHQGRVGVAGVVKPNPDKTRLAGELPPSGADRIREPWSSVKLREHEVNGARSNAAQRQTVGGLDVLVLPKDECG